MRRELNVWCYIFRTGSAPNLGARLRERVRRVVRLWHSSPTAKRRSCRPHPGLHINGVHRQSRNSSQVTRWQTTFSRRECVVRESGSDFPFCSPFLPRRPFCHFVDSSPLPPIVPLVTKKASVATPSHCVWILRQSLPPSPLIEDSCHQIVVPQSRARLDLQERENVT